MVKQLVNKAVYIYHSNRLTEEAQTKSSLKYIYFNNSKDGKVHNIWKSCGSEPYAVISAALKTKIATGTIILQKQVSRFSANNTKTPICQLCSKEIEDILHFIVRCSALQKVRSPFLTAIQDAIYSNVNKDISDDILKNEENLCQIIMVTQFAFLPKKLQIRLESISRGLCHSLAISLQINPAKKGMTILDNIRRQCVIICMHSWTFSFCVVVWVESHTPGGGAIHFI